MTREHDGHAGRRAARLVLRIVMTAIFFLWFLVPTVLCLTLSFIAALLTLPFNRKGDGGHFAACCWGWLVMHSNPWWRVRVAGAPRPEGACVYVANHLSQLDILLALSTFRDFRFISKRSIFRIPLIGWAMIAARYIALDRGSTASARRMKEACLRTLARGRSLLIFPEGTRSPDGQIQTFKPGAFAIAAEAGVPIVPCVIRGTGDALPKKGVLLAGRARISLEFLAPVTAVDVRAAPPRELAGRIESDMRGKLVS